MVIGLTGGVGCGKSTVMDYLKKRYHAYIIESDKVAKEIMNPGNKVYDEIVKAFPEVLDAGEIDRNKLAQIVFADKDNLLRLNAITHPGTINEILRRMKKAENDIIVIESAILLGSGLENYCDELWFVYCDLETRIERLMLGRGYSREKSISIINSQPSDEEYNRFADEYIDNSHSENDTKEQIDMILGTTFC